jgi:flagellar biosynthetic protein FliP
MNTTITAKPSRGRQILRFLRHFVEMVLAMLLGMAVFGVVNEAILIPMGFAYLSARVFPEAYALTMAVSMTVPMVAWMRIRKHPWRLSAEMAGAMILPTVVLIAICSIGLLPHTVVIPGTHLLMVPAMLGAMLSRWRDYSCH